jgi:hypothetical protein
MNLAEGDSLVAIARNAESASAADGTVADEIVDAGTVADGTADEAFDETGDITSAGPEATE